MEVQNPNPINESGLEIIDPVVQPSDEIHAIADEIPSAEDTTREADLRLAEQERLINARDNMRSEIKGGMEGVISDTEEKIQNEARLAEIDRHTAELSGSISSLKQESRKLGGEITQHTYASAWAEDRLSKLDDEVEEAIKKIDGDLEENKQLIDLKAFEDMNAIDDEYKDQINELVRLWNEEVKDMDAGTLLTGRVVSDSEGNLSASRPGNMSRVDENVKDNGSEKVKQTAWGGEIAADLTKGEFDKIHIEIAEKKRVITDEAEAKKSELEKTAKEQREGEEKLGEEKNTASLEAITNANNEIGVLSKKQEEVKVELSAKEGQLEALQLEREGIVGKVEGLGGQIEKYQKIIKTNQEWLSRVMEKIEVISEKGAEAVEAMLQAEKVVDGAIRNVKATAEIMTIGVDKTFVERMREAKNTLDAKIKVANEGFEEQIVVLETSLLMDESLGFGVDAKGRLLTTPSRYLENRKQRRALEKLDPYADKLEQDRDSEITAARDEFSDRRERVFDAAEAERTKIEEARLVAVAKLTQAAVMAKLVRETAADVFGTGPTTAEADTKKANLFSRGVSAIRRMFGGQ